MEIFSFYHGNYRIVSFDKNQNNASNNNSSSVTQGGFQVELLGPEDRMISRLTPGSDYVSDDPTRQSFSVSLPSEECRGCAVCGSHDYLCMELSRVNVNN